MNKYLPYILGVLILAGVLALFITDKNNQKKKKSGAKVLDERITLKKKDKIPYGTYVAYKGLKQLFPEAQIITNRQEPGFWDSLSLFEKHQALIIVADNFNADDDEMRRLIRFAKSGNDVFISAKELSGMAPAELEVSTIDLSEPTFEEEEGILIASDDSLLVRLRKPYFETDTIFAYPGRNFSSSFTKVNNEVANEIGDGVSGLTNFIHLKAGKGNIYLHLAPLAFSNYFLLHKKNIRYYEMIMSVISPDVQKIAWDEYFMSKTDIDFTYDNRRKRRDWFTVMMNKENSEGKKPFRAALWILILLLLAYVLLEMRRKQRQIPEVKKPRNDSLEFVKTIGRLYHDKGDHRNLCRKMTAYFYEHIRSKYKLRTNVLDESFVKALHQKTGVPEQEIQEIVQYIGFIDTATTVTEKHLSGFYGKLEAFYQKA
ncbi:MAG: DUF4350 domain-containing protein [Chitinophagaceae bacterium]|nr:DUF4350 domain-containing protein [Chitinophagaceae bacterium]